MLDILTYFTCIISAHLGYTAWGRHSSFDREENWGLEKWNNPDRCGFKMASAKCSLQTTLPPARSCEWSFIGTQPHLFLWHYNGRLSSSNRLCGPQGPGINYSTLSPLCVDPLCVSHTPIVVVLTLRVNKSWVKHAPVIYLFCLLMLQCFVV